MSIEVVNRFTDTHNVSQSQLIPQNDLKHFILLYTMQSILLSIEF